MLALWRDTLTQAPVLLYGGTLALGLIIGSFLNVVVLRLPVMMEREWRRDCAELAAGDDAAAAAEERFDLIQPPSICLHCGQRIAPWDNIPLLSWLLLRGHCRACGGTIALRYPLIEAGTALLSLLVVWRFGVSVQAVAALVLTWGLIALALIDLDTQLLPDSITQPLLWLGLLLSLAGVFSNSTDAILGALFGFLSLWLVFHGFRLLTGKEGMGRGDFKLLALLGAWLGWQAVPQIILFSAVPGAVVGVALIASGRQQVEQPMPYGPFLAIAGWISLLWGEAITTAYLRFSGLVG
ncbi:MAG: prepilin peptidase [Chromatiaceae bacterium]|nr:MAG: prepilin peptidase [Chromatiaceae bacterium]